MRHMPQNQFQLNKFYNDHLFQIKKCKKFTTFPYIQHNICAKYGQQTEAASRDSYMGDSGETKEIISNKQISQRKDIGVKTW